ncbi:hypothetical protein [Dysgonomonas sp. 520]|uniref:hypothetical protein n=1 Tax=Dysgonomonas sp. 520 TaxID=2302931 RepID=UPI0016275B26|nr:hypothetical protein [Dysgonomonas sp. 520]
MWWIFGIAVIGFIIYTINKEYKKEVSTKLTNQGGMLQKYSVIINHFVNGVPAKVTKVTKDSVVITASAMEIYLDYVGGNLEVELRGVAPVIGKHSKKWKYPNGYPQEKMITEIQNYCEWQANRIGNNNTSIEMISITKDATNKLLNTGLYKRISTPKSRFEILIFNAAIVAWTYVNESKYKNNLFEDYIRFLIKEAPKSDIYMKDDDLIFFINKRLKFYLSQIEILSENPTSDLGCLYYCFFKMPINDIIEREQLSDKEDQCFYNAIVEMINWTSTQTLKRL